MKNSLNSFLILTTLAAQSASAAVTFSDNYASNSLSNYTVVGSSGQIIYGSTSGVSGGGGLSVTPTGNPSTSIISNTNFTVGSGAVNQLTMSVFVQKSSGGFSGTSQAFLGISNDDNYSWGQNSDAGFSSLGLALQSSQIGFRSAVNGVSGNSSSNGGMTGSATYTNGNWYKLTTIITKPVSGNIWTISGSVDNWGSTGAAFSSNLLTLGITNVTIADATFNSAATATYGQFGTRNGAWTAADNFTMTAIPEPSSSLLAAIGVFGLVGLRRRNTSV